MDAIVKRETAISPSFFIPAIPKFGLVFLLLGNDWKKG